MIKRVVLGFFCVLMCLCAISSSLFAAKGKTADECFSEYLNALRMNREKKIVKYSYYGEDDLEKRKREFVKTLKSRGLSKADILREVRKMGYIQKTKKIGGAKIWVSVKNWELKEKKIEGKDVELGYIAIPDGYSSYAFDCEKIFIHVKMKKVEDLWKVVSIRGRPLEEYIRDKKKELAEKRKLAKENKLQK